MKRKMEGTYKQVEGKDKVWLVPSDGNTNRIFMVDALRQDGFYGDVVWFNMVDGEELPLIGPWHSNKQALARDTGIVL